MTEDHNKKKQQQGNNEDLEKGILLRGTASGDEGPGRLSLKRWLLSHSCALTRYMRQLYGICIEGLKVLGGLRNSTHSMTAPFMTLRYSTNDERVRRGEDGK